MLGQVTITYQGQPFEGTANLEFRLFADLEGGSQIGLGQTFVNHPIDGGLFQVELTTAPRPSVPASVSSKSGSTARRWRRGSSALNSPEGNRLRVNGPPRVDTLGTARGDPLCRNAYNQITACSSSSRYKRDIEDLSIPPGLIERLRPVRHHWIDDGQPDIGFVAEEIAELVPELATRNEQGQIEGIKYDRLTALLVQAVQQDRIQQRRTETLLADLQADNQQLRTQVSALEEQVEPTAQLMLGNAELEARLAVLESMLFDGRRVVAQP